MAEVRARPLCGNCDEPLRRGEHACLGISPFNSYFSVERVAGWARWALATFARVHLFVPDTAAAYTLEALGYSPERAAAKARRQGRYLRNKIHRALRSLGVDEPDKMILDSAVLDQSDRYRTLHAQVRHNFDHHERFRGACLAASRWVLEGRVPDPEMTDEQLRRAARYLLAELPLFLDTASIVDARASVFCYHQAPPFL
ncbi:MAG: tRNA-dependent cyclodipeptide synthase, partial [Haloechinothrix sp.]